MSHMGCLPSSLKSTINIVEVICGQTSTIREVAKGGPEESLAVEAEGSVEWVVDLVAKRGEKGLTVQF